MDVHPLSLCAAALLCVAGCVSNVASTRVSTPLRAQEFNSIASQYMERPTFVSYDALSNGAKVLRVTMDTYRTDSAGMHSSVISFEQGHENEYIAAIDKYLAWEQLARDRGDSLTKDIGRVATQSGGTGELKFGFHSGNAQQHFLTVAWCSVGLCLDEQAQYYDREGALQLRTMLVDLQSGVIREKDYDSIYK